jgi:glycosyltransferase involved in cell wall biosynthesis
VPEEPGACGTCLPRNDHATHGQPDVEEWRLCWQRALDAAGEVRFFSAASLAIAQRAFAIEPGKLRIEPHAPLTSFDGRRVRLPHATELVIGVVGTISGPKGGRIVRDMARRLAVVRPNSRIVLIGDIDPTYLDRADSNLLVHGKYDRECLPDLLEGYGVGVCVLPSIIPETFSYVTQELIQLEMPLVCFDLGAPAERVGRYRWGRVVKEVTAQAMLDAALALGRQARSAREAAATA